MRDSRARYFVFVVVIGAAVFGLYLGYVAWSNDSFPVQQRPFGDYASVQSATFNGTEFAFTLKWSDGGYLPLFAQLTSKASNAANTPVCGIGLSSVQSGQVIFLPFTIKPSSTSLTSVNLSVAVKPAAGGGDFTILYTVASVSAVTGNITPSNLSCQQSAGSGR
jgi:hypothetical protein